MYSIQLRMCLIVAWYVFIHVHVFTYLFIFVHVFTTAFLEPIANHFLTTEGILSLSLTGCNQIPREQERRGPGMSC